MATCHPCVISVFFIGLILNAITINSQLRPWRENNQQHVFLISSFLETFPHFCEYISTSLDSFKAVLKNIYSIYKEIMYF